MWKSDATNKMKNIFTFHSICAQKELYVSTPFLNFNKSREIGLRHDLQRRHPIRMFIEITLYTKILLFILSFFIFCLLLLFRINYYKFWMRWRKTTPWRYTLIYSESKSLKKLRLTFFNILITEIYEILNENSWYFL